MSTTRTRRCSTIAAVAMSIATTITVAGPVAADPLDGPYLATTANIVWPGYATGVETHNCGSGELRLYRDPDGARTLVGAVGFADDDGDGLAGAAFAIPSWVPDDQDLWVEGWCDDPDAFMGRGQIWLMPTPAGSPNPPVDGAFSATSASASSTISFEGRGCDITGASARLSLYPTVGRGPGVLDRALAEGGGTVVDGAISAAIDLPAALEPGEYLLVSSCTDASGTWTKGWEPQVITVHAAIETTTTTTTTTTTSTTAPTTTSAPPTTATTAPSPAPRAAGATPVRAAAAYAG